MIAPKRREFQLETSSLQHIVNPGSWSRDSQPELCRAKEAGRPIGGGRGHTPPRRARIAWVSARLAPKPTRTPPPLASSQSGGPSPGSSVAPYRGDRSRHVSPVSHCFCFLPDREVLGSQGKSSLPLPRRGALSSRSTAGVRAEGHLPHVSPLGNVGTCQVGRFFAS